MLPHIYRVKRKGCKKVKSLNLSIQSWDGHERRKRARRTEDVQRCIFCNEFFSWHSCGPICSACVPIILSSYKRRGVIIDIIA